MRTSHRIAVIGMAVAPMAVITTGLALAAQPPAPPPPTTPTYICDSMLVNDPAYFAATNCQPFAGAQSAGFIDRGISYTITPRSGDPLGNVQSFRCFGGVADTPTSITPQKCSAIGSPVQASLAPSAIPFTPAYSVPPALPKK